MIEPLNELPAPDVVLPPCDIRYVTLGLHAGSKDYWWTCDWHKTLSRAEAEAEYCVPGTLRIFEVPEVKHGE